MSAIGVPQISAASAVRSSKSTSGTVSGSWSSSRDPQRRSFIFWQRIIHEKKLEERTRTRRRRGIAGETGLSLIVARSPNDPHPGGSYASVFYISRNFALLK